MTTKALSKSDPRTRAVARSAMAMMAMLALTATTGCTAIGDIFKAGAWIVFVVVAAIAAILFGVVRIFSGKK